MITLILISFLNFSSHAQTLTVPNTCKDLLPELGPYIEFMEQVGSLWINSSPKSSKKIYEALAIRTLYQQTTRDYNNPIDKMLKDLICECYRANDGQSFNADSRVVRKFMNRNIDRFIRSATDKYVDLKLQIYEQERAGRINEKLAKRIEEMKRSSVRAVEKRSNAIFSRKLKRYSSR